jgi:hypothetical protein
MAVITSGKTFANGEQLSASKLNQVITAATFNASDAVDGSTMTLVGGAMAVRDDGITTAKINTDAVETAKIKDANVTLPKIATQADQTVLANVSGGTASPTAVDIVGATGLLINNDSLGTDDTKGATQGNIKAFVENLIGTADKSGSGVVTEGTHGSITLGGGLIIKFGSHDASSSTTTLTFKNSSGSNSPFPTAIYGVMLTCNEDFSLSAETVSASDLALGSCTVRSYAASSGSAAGRVFFIAIGH